MTPEGDRLEDTRNHPARALAEQFGDAIRDPLFVADGDGRLVFVNVAGLETFGYAAAEIDGLSSADLLPRIPLPANPAPRADPGRIVLEGRRRDGSVFPAQITLGKVTVEGVDLSIAIVRDLTEQLRVERELRRTTERLTEAERLARLGSWEWDIPKNEVTWSDELFRIYGLEPGETEPSYEEFLNRVHPDDRESVDARNHKAFADHQPFDDVKRCCRPDGSVFLMRTQGEMITDEQGNPLRMLGVCEDVTVEKQAERAAAELASLVRSSADAIISRTVDGTITGWNPGATEMYGWEAEEMIGKPISKLVPEESCGRVRGEDRAPDRG